MSCELCGRDKPLTFHHLIPKAVHHRKRYRKKYTMEELRSTGIDICRKCHSGIHDLLTEKELAEGYTTLESLQAHEGVKKHVAWVRKQK